MTDTTLRLLRMKQVTERTTLSKSTLYAKIQRGEFPAGQLIGNRCRVWTEEQVSDWIRECANIGAAV